MADPANNQKMLSCDELLQKKFEGIADEELERLGFPNACKKNASKTMERVLEIDKSQKEIKSLYSQLGLRMAKLSAMENEKKKSGISGVTGTTSGTTKLNGTVDPNDVSLMLRKPMIHSSFPSVKNMKREEDCISNRDKNDDNNDSHSSPKYIKTSSGERSVVKVSTPDVDSSVCAPIIPNTDTQWITSKDEHSTKIDKQHVAYTEECDEANSNMKMDTPNIRNKDAGKDKEYAGEQNDENRIKEIENKDERGQKTEIKEKVKQRDMEQVQLNERSNGTVPEKGNRNNNEDRTEIGKEREEKTEQVQETKEENEDGDEGKNLEEDGNDIKNDKEEENNRDKENENENRNDLVNEYINDSGKENEIKTKNQKEKKTGSNGRYENDDANEGGRGKEKEICEEIALTTEKKNGEDQAREPNERGKTKEKTVGKHKSVSKKHITSLKTFNEVPEKKHDIQIGSIVYAKPDGSDAWFEAEVEKELADSNSRSKKKTKSSQLRFLGGKGLRQNIPFNRIASKSCVGVADIEIGSRVVAGRPSDTVSSTVLKKCKTLGRSNIVDVMYAGVVAELACEGNFYRYLVFFDDGYAQYHHLQKLFLAVKPSFPVWADVSEHCRGFIKEYLEDYPSRPFLQAGVNSIIRTEWDGEWWESKVVAYDASLVKIHYDSDSHTEWIYRGTTRLEPIHDYFNSTKPSKKKKKKKKKNEETKYEESEVCIDDRITDPQFGICKYSLRDPNGVQQRVEWNVPAPSLALIARQTSTMTSGAKEKTANSKNTTIDTDDDDLRSAMDDEVFSIMSQKEVFDVLDALQSES